MTSRTCADVDLGSVVAATDQTLADALGSIDGDASVFVDFDHTLFACNSSELFIASCKPSILVALIDVLIRRCIPWRLTGLEQWFRIRDYVCCLSILIACPWNLLIWRRIAPRLFREHVSDGISQALSNIEASRLIIVTFGMDFIVGALLRGSAWHSARLVATPLLAWPGYFSRGKRVLVEERFGPQAVGASVFVTDSMDDGDLLAAVRSGVLVEPQGEVFRALERLYIPLRYTARAKYTPSYVFDQIVLVEFLLTLISVTGSLNDLVAKLPTLALLSLSLMCVYEIGYFENDMVASRRESAPTLTRHVDRFAFYPMQPAAWLWAAASGLGGVLLAVATGLLPPSGMAAAALSWAVSLVLLRLLFRAYNGAGVRARLLLYPALQLMKFLPIFILVPPTRFGAVLAFAHVATMWMIYLVYRYGGDRRNIEKELIRTILIAAGLCLLATTGPIATPDGLLSLLLIALWSSARLIKAPALKLLRRRLHPKTGVPG